jgi:hypothetical protein
VSAVAVTTRTPNVSGRRSSLAEHPFGLFVIERTRRDERCSIEEKQNLELAFQLRTDSNPLAIGRVLSCGCGGLHDRSELKTE